MPKLSTRAWMPILSAGIGLSLFASSFVSGYLLRHMTPGTTLSLIVALVPLPVFIANFAIAFVLARRCDEMQRRIQFEALAFAYPFVMLGCLTIFMIHKAGFRFSFDLIDVFLAMTLVYAGSVFVARSRYQ